MLILTSPAKTFDLTAPVPKGLSASKPRFLEKTTELHGILQTKSAKDLQHILKISSKLAELNEERLQQWSKNHIEANSRPAAFAFKGDVMQQLDLTTYSQTQLEYLNANLITLSGLYGYLHGFDLVQPYRLEMGTDVPGIGLLAAYWKDTITDALNKEIEKEDHSLVLNLASQEYSAAVDLPQLKAPVLSVDFKQVRNGELKTFGLLAKRARGMMIDFCAKQNVQSRKELKIFSEKGYQFEQETDEKMLFVLNDDNN